MRYILNISIFLISLSILGLPVRSLGQSSMDKKADSLILLLPSVKDSIVKVDLLNEISYAYRRTNFEKILTYALQAKALAIQEGYKKGEAIAFKNIGISKLKSGVRHDSVVYFFQTAADLAAEIEDYYTQAACLNNIGLVYYYKADYNKAIQGYLKGIEVFDTHFEENSRLKTLMIANVGKTFYHLGDYQKAEEYLTKAIEIGIEKNYKTIPSIYLDDLGKTLAKLNRYKEAEEVFKKALSIQDGLGDHLSKIQTLQNLSDFLIKKGDYKKAEESVLSSLTLAQDKNAELDVTYSLVQLIKIYIKQNKIDQAIEHGQLAIQKSKRIANKNFEIEAKGYLHQAYALKKDFANAYVISYELLTLSDSLRNSDSKELTAELEAKLRLREHEQEISFLNKKKEDQQSRIKLLWILIATILGSALTIFYLGYKRAKGNKIIQQQNEELKKYIDHNLQLENFAYVASHDLRTPLRTIVSFAQLLKRSVKDKLNSNELEYLNFIEQGGTEMSHLVNDIFDYSVIEKSEIRKEPINLEHLLDNVIMSMDATIQKHKACIQYNLSDSTTIGDRIKLQQLFQNLLVNAVKFHKPGENPEIRIRSKTVENETLFEVQDNGIGIDKKFYDTIFVVLKRLNNKKDYEGTGIGLSICKKIVEQHNGKIWVDSTVGEGSSFYFTLPK